MNKTKLVEPRGAYLFDDIWDHVLPDGLPFCHWGGESVSRRIISLLDIHSSDRLLDICCGYGGTMMLLPRINQIVGIDLSQRALVNRKSIKGQVNSHVLRADAHRMPFRDCTFTKLIAQDADAWLQPNRDELMTEIHRIAAANCLFAFQSYISSDELPESALLKTNSLLRQCGYGHTNVLTSRCIVPLFNDAGFEIQLRDSLHEVYAADNISMIHRISASEPQLRRVFGDVTVDALKDLLTWEKVLFERGWWTGQLIVARKRTGVKHV